MAMMILGLFPFHLRTLPYHTFGQRLSWRHPGNSRVGANPARQFLGPDEDTITLGGQLMTAVTGGPSQVSTLRVMADTGKAWPLIEGTGRFFGLYLITGLDETRRTFFADGAAREMDFELTLVLADDRQVDNLASASTLLSLL